MTFRIPKIKSCCCFSLETGTKIIGCLQMLTFVAVLSLPPIFESSRFLAGVLQGIVYESLFLNFGIFAIIMLYGTYKRDHHLVFPWILLQSIFMLFFLISIFGGLVYLGLMDKRLSYMEFEFLFTVYFFSTILVVYNYYRELVEGSPELI